MPYSDFKKTIFHRSLKRAHPRRPPARLPKVLYPHLIEERYLSELQEILKFLKARVDARIKPLLPKLTKHYARKRKDSIDFLKEPAKYYTAFIYANNADVDVLHCTHKYLGELSRSEAIEAEKIIDRYFTREERKLPRVDFTQRQHFGVNNDIPVLTPKAFDSRDFFIDLQIELEDEFRDEDYPEYRPHVTTNKKAVTKPFKYFALICKKGVVRTWPKTVKNDDDDWTTTADMGDLADQIEKVRIDFVQAYSKDELKRLAAVTGQSVEQWNAKQMNGQLKGIVEVDVLGSEPWLAKEMGAFVVSNVSLINSIEDEYLNQVTNTIANAVRTGTRVEDLAADLEDRYDVSKSRAELIARDQVGKFQGQLTEKRQTDLGIEGYIWRDSGDVRVRPSHHDLNGESQTWDSPPPVGHPGQDYQCRCSAEPDLAKFYDDDLQ